MPPRFATNETFRLNLCSLPPRSTTHTPPPKYHGSARRFHNYTPFLAKEYTVLCIIKVDFRAAAEQNTAMPVNEDLITRTAYKSKVVGLGFGIHKSLSLSHFLRCVGGSWIEEEEGKSDHRPAAAFSKLYAGGRL